MGFRGLWIWLNYFLEEYLFENIVMTYSTFGNQHEIRLKNSLVKLTNPQTPIAKKSPNIFTSNHEIGLWNRTSNRFYFKGRELSTGEIFHIRELSTRGDIPHSGNTDLIRCFTRVRPSFGDLAISEQGGNSIMRNT